MVDFLKSLGSNDKLTLEQLTRKLVVLLALVMAHRASDLVRLSLTGRTYTPEGVILTCSGLAKTSKPGKEKDMQSVIITSFEEQCYAQSLASELMKLQLRNSESQMTECSCL